MKRWSVISNIRSTMNIIHHAFASHIIKKNCDLYVLESNSDHFHPEVRMLEGALQTVNYSVDVSDHIIETNTQDGNNMDTNHNTHYKNMMHT